MISPDDRDLIVLAMTPAEVEAELRRISQIHEPCNEVVRKNPGFTPAIRRLIWAVTVFGVSVGAFVALNYLMR